MAYIYSYETDELYHINASVEYAKKRYMEKYEVDESEFEQLMFLLHIKIIDDATELDIDDLLT
jgi:hypothetical protein